MMQVTGRLVLVLLLCMAGCTPPTSEDAKKKEATDKFFASPTPSKEHTPKGFTP